MKLDTLNDKMVYPFKLPELPFAKNSLLPHITEETIDYHYGKHHQTYVNNLNDIISKDDKLKGKTLEELIILSAKDSAKVGIFNNAAQIWNLTFYWHCMKPKGGGKPEGNLMKMIKKAFGDYDTFEEQFKQAAVSQFGSGWAWLVLDKEDLKITKTSNADLPLNHSHRALLTIDVWEHAYYIDYRNRRPDYVKIFFQHLVNWDFVNENLTKI